MRSIPFLALVGVLGVLLTACPAAGPGLSFTGTYTGTFGGARAASPLPEALRGIASINVMLTQIGTNVSGTFTNNLPGPREQPNRGLLTFTITATVGEPGQAAGTITQTSPTPEGPIDLFLFLTATQDHDLILFFPSLPPLQNFALILERQP